MLLVDEKLSIGGRDGKLAMGLLLVVVVLSAVADDADGDGGS